MGLRLRSKFGRLRRRDKVLGVVGAVVVVACLVLALVPLHSEPRVQLGRRLLGSSEGAIWMYFNFSYPPGFAPPAAADDVAVWFERAILRADWTWMLEYHSLSYPTGITVTYVNLPLWIPLLVGLALTTPSALHMRRMRFDPCFCPTCDYDLTGIDGVCPECGGGR